MANSIATCQAQFSWMNNQEGQSPCLVASWLIAVCQGLNGPAQLAPLSHPNYDAPNGTSATACTCSWSFYNTVQACTLCQDHVAESYSDWSPNCGLVGKSSTSEYWPSSEPLSNTSLPRWSIFDPTKWDRETFNVPQAQAIANQSLPDATDGTAAQPTLPPSASSTSSNSSPKKVPIGAIVGGVVGGILFLALLALLLWYFHRQRHRMQHARNRSRSRDIDLNAEKPLESPAINVPLRYGHAFDWGFGMSSDTVGVPSPQPYTTQGDQQMQQMRQMQMMQQSSVGMSPNMAMSPTNTTSSMYSSPGAGMSYQNANVQSPPPGAGYAFPGIMRAYALNNGRAPTVEEQLQEKRRIRAERAHPPSAFASSPSAPGRDSFTTAHDTSSSSGAPYGMHSQSPSLSSLPDTRAAPTSDGHPSSPSSPDLRQAVRPPHARRASLLKAPWYRRRAAVSEAATSDAGDAVSERMADATPPAVDALMAAVPGARLPTARERAAPPPMYSSDINSGGDTRRMTIMNDAREG